MPLSQPARPAGLAPAGRVAPGLGASLLFSKRFCRTLFGFFFFFSERFVFGTLFANVFLATNVFSACLEFATKKFHGNGFQL